MALEEEANNLFCWSRKLVQLVQDCNSELHEKITGLFSLLNGCFGILKILLKVDEM